MALVKCGDCGKEVSDKAATCINCGCPMTAKTGKVRIKLPQSGVGEWFVSKACSITNRKTSKIYWEGRMGQVAEFELFAKTDLLIKIGGVLNNPLICTIDPAEGLRYAITQDMGIHLRGTYNISKVDVIDS